MKLIKQCLKCNYKWEGKNALGEICPKCRSTEVNTSWIKK